jgi:hypothetical protein
LSIRRICALGCIECHVGHLNRNKKQINQLKTSSEVHQIFPLWNHLHAWSLVQATLYCTTLYCTTLYCTTLCWSSSATQLTSAFPYLKYNTPKFVHATVFCKKITMYNLEFTLPPRRCSNSQLKYLLSVPELTW